MTAQGLFAWVTIQSDKTTTTATLTLIVEQHNKVSWNEFYNLVLITGVFPLKKSLTLYSAVTKNIMPICLCVNKLHFCVLSSPAMCRFDRFFLIQMTHFFPEKFPGSYPEKKLQIQFPNEANTVSVIKLFPPGCSWPLTPASWWNVDVHLCPVWLNFSKTAAVSSRQTETCPNRPGLFSKREEEKKDEGLFVTEFTIRCGGREGVILHLYYILPGGKAWMGSGPSFSRSEEKQVHSVPNLRSVFRNNTPTTEMCDDIISLKTSFKKPCRCWEKRMCCFCYCTNRRKMCKACTDWQRDRRERTEVT